MGKITICLLLLVLCPPIFAQSNSGKGSVTGYIKELNGGFLESATVRIFSERDTGLVGGTLTDASGYFIIEELPYGSYRIVASLVGHANASMGNIRLTGRNSSFFADTIYLKPGETSTEQIDVTAERSLVEFRDDKKIYNVENSILNKGGTATEILRRIPSVEVDQDGNISLRGSSNVRFMIDGKMVRQNITAILEQTPASSVESIEIITNPGSRYEAEGNAGLINIVLKKGVEMTGYAGQFSLGAGNRDKYSGALTLSKKNSKLNLYGNYNFRDFDNRMEGGSTLTNFFISDPKTILESTNSMMDNKSHMFKAGTDLYISPQTTMGFVASYLFRKRNSSGTTNTENINDAGQTILNEETKSSETDDGNAFDASVTYNRIFSSPKHTLSAELTFALNNDDEDIYSNTSYFDASMNSLGIDPETRKSLNSENVYSGSFQLDYVQPLSSPQGGNKGRKEQKRGENKPRGGRESEPGSKIETGLKLSHRNLGSDSKGELFDYVTNVYVNDSTVTNNFDYKESILGAYAIYAHKFGSLDVLAGLRGEYTGTDVFNQRTNEGSDNSYFDVFPSISMAYAVSLSDRLQANYSRRINRPEPRTLVPFVDYSNPSNLRTGNPDLKPEFTNSFQLSYLKFFEGFTVNPTLYYRHTSDAISRFRVQIDSVTTLTTFENLEKIDAYGAEIILGYQGENNLIINGSANYSYNDIKGSPSTNVLNNSGSAVTAKLNAGIRAWYGIDIQLAYTYQGKRPTALGYIRPFSTFEAGLKKDLLNDALSIGLRFSDIFNKQKFNFQIDGENYSQDTYRKRESRFAFLTVTYNFGVKEVKQTRRRGSDDGREPDIDF